jgi:hypothetical protein
LQLQAVHWGYAPVSEEVSLSERFAQIESPFLSSPSFALEVGVPLQGALHPNNGHSQVATARPLCADIVARAGQYGASSMSHNVDNLVRLAMASRRANGCWNPIAEAFRRELPQPWGLPRGLHRHDRQADRQQDQAEISAHRRLLVSARRHPDRRVLADRPIAEGYVAPRSGRRAVSRTGVIPSASPKRQIR